MTEVGDRPGTTTSCMSEGAWVSCGLIDMDGSGLQVVGLGMGEEGGLSGWHAATPKTNRMPTLTKERMSFNGDPRCNCFFIRCIYMVFTALPQAEYFPWLSW